MVKVIFFLLTFLSDAVLSSENGSLFLGVNIEPHFQIRIEPFVLGQDPLDIVGGETLRKIAEVNEVSNNPAGYEMYVESANGGSLLNSSGNGPSYQIQYGLTGALVTPGAVGSPVLIRTNTPLAGLTFSLIDLLFSVDANPTLGAGYYTDTLIFTMQAL